MKIVADISTTSPFLRPRGPGQPVIITATVTPMLGPLRDGDSTQQALSAGALDTGNYASAAGAITGVAASVTINGAAGALADAVAFTDLVAVALTVTDASGNTRVFNAGTQSVAGHAPVAQTAPAITGNPAPGETVAIAEGTYDGTPAPAITGTLTLGGVTVSGEMSGTDYTIPAGTSGQVLKWSEVASNGVAPNATQSVSDTVQAVFDPASLFANGEGGAIYAIWDPGTLFSDTAGTVPAVAGDTVAFIRDVSGNGNHGVISNASKRPVLRDTPGGFSYLELDSVDDELSVSMSPYDLTQGASFAFASDQLFQESSISGSLQSSSDGGGARFTYLPYNPNNGGRRIGDAFSVSAGRIEQTGIPTVGKVVSLARSSGTEATFQENGVQTISNTQPSAPSGPTDRILVNTPASNFRVHFYGGVFLLRDMTGAEQQALSDFLTSVNGF